MRGIVKGSLIICMLFGIISYFSGMNVSAATIVNKTIYVNVDVANIRSGASTDYKVVAQLKNGTKLVAFEQFTNSKNELWYRITLPDQRKGWIASWVVKTSLPQKVLLSAPLISQLPELPRGCEVTSLAMLLNYAGIKADKMTLAKQVAKDPTPYRKVDDKVYFGNPNIGFVGDMYDKSKPGYGVYHKPIEALTRKYLGSRVVNLTGKPFTSVTNQLDKKKPVWIIANSWFTKLPSTQFQYFYTNQGPVKITYREHSVLVTGYDSQYIYFNDPLTNEKNRKINRTNFVAAWEQMGKQAISYN
ncbi:hypothetical protein AWM68_13580 [Fictibacillus phosphorivorans]|uniref:SH3b domain-containing protein n=1 Tax=Fictibacillus phosphorivorans TaxID=1221500 RepID=A0A163PU00_9BACL|nr:C39 family peptidase [Fictibacillus phosphorivorans]KZE64132.1 hypothetical protein AWM68_13580 [Fictibacillus phosphorivorans]